MGIPFLRQGHSPLQIHHLHCLYPFVLSGLIVSLILIRVHFPISIEPPLGSRHSHLPWQSPWGDFLPGFEKDYPGD